MLHLRVIGAGIAVFGGVVGIVRLSSRRRLTAADIMRLDEKAFEERMRATGMEAQVRSALSRVDRGAA